MSEPLWNLHHLLPPTAPEKPIKKWIRPAPSSSDSEGGPVPKKPKIYQDNPFDMLHLECFTYVMSALGERGLTMYADLKYPFQAS